MVYVCARECVRDRVRLNRGISAFFKQIVVVVVEVVETIQDVDIVSITIYAQ